LSVENKLKKAVWLPMLRLKMSQRKANNNEEFFIFSYKNEKYEFPVMLDARYRVGNHIAHGSNSVVLKCYDMQCSDRNLIIKIVSCA
jgi:hypothetical protein